MDTTEVTPGDESGGPDVAPTERSDTPGGPAPVVTHPFAVLRNGAFRALWLNTFGFILIRSTQQFAYVWLVLELGGGPSAAGLAAFSLGIPVLFLALPAGVLSDRLDRRMLMVISQLGAMAVTALTAVLIWRGWITIPIAFALAVAVGMTTALGTPVRQAIVPSIVPKERLQNAVALMTLGMNVSFMVGPAVSGGIIEAWGLDGAFAAQTGIYALTLLPLIGLRLPTIVQDGPRRRMHHDIREGLSFIWHHKGILALIGLLTTSGMFMIGPFQALLPVIARDRLGRGAFEASLLFVALGAGMLITSLSLASAKDLRRKGLIFTSNMILGGVLFAGIGLSTVYPLTMALMFFWGMGGGLFINLNQTLIQANTPNELMGRVMSVHTVSFQGVGPIGALMAGAGAAALGIPVWVSISGVLLCTAAILALLTQPELRRMS